MPSKDAIQVVLGMGPRLTVSQLPQRFKDVFAQHKGSKLRRDAWFYHVVDTTIVTSGSRQNLDAVFIHCTSVRTTKFLRRARKNFNEKYFRYNMDMSLLFGDEEFEVDSDPIYYCEGKRIETAQDALTLLNVGRVEIPITEPKIDKIGMETIYTQMQAPREQFRYAGAKHQLGVSDERTKPLFVRERVTITPEIHPFWKLLGVKEKPRLTLADADLISYLRYQVLCQPRTINLVNSLRLKATRFLAEFDMSEFTLEQVYNMVADSIAEVLIPSPAEERMVQRLNEGHRLLSKYDTFFSKGQYRKAGWFTSSRTLGLSS